MHLPCLIVWRAIHSLKHRSKWQSLSGIEEKGSRKKIGKIHERRSCFLSCLPPLGLVLTHGRCATMEKENKTQSRAFVRSRAQARSLFFLLSSLFSLLSSLFSLLSSPCRCSVATPRSQETSHLLDSITSLLSLFSSLFHLLCVLASLAAAHFAERSSHFSLRTLHQAIDSAPNSTL